MFSGCKSPHAQGNIGLGVAIAWFTQNQYTVSIPLNDSQDYDLVIDDGNGIRTVQVKTARNKSKRYGTYKVELRSKRSKDVMKFFTSNRSDFLFVVTGDGTKYFLPCSALQNRRSLDVGTAKFSNWIVK